MKNKKPKKTEITGVVSIVAHQLKTPLSVIKGVLESLVSGDCGRINSLQEEYLEDALENVERMKKTIENLLTVQKIEEGKYKIKLKPLALENVTFKVLSDLSIWAKALNCEISLKKPERIPKVLGDIKNIGEIIENFVSNAIRYSRGKGKVELSLGLTQKGDQVVFSCKDNGIGILKKNYKYIFTKFYREEQALELDPSGSGLGLYISKAFIEASGGKIWFTKNKGPGMTFYFSLPLAKRKGKR